MHNKLVGTKEFGRTIRIHNTPLPPRSYAQSFASFRTRSFTTYRLTHKADKNNSNMDSLINTTCFHKVTESANN